MSPILLKLCASFPIHQWIQTGVTVRKHPICVQFEEFFLAVWPYPAGTRRNNNVFTTSTRRRRRRVDVVKTLSLRHYCVMCPLGKIKRMTLKNNRAPLLCYFKLCASFRSHWWIQTGVTVRKRPIWVKFNDFLAVWPWHLTDDIEKQ